MRIAFQVLIDAVSLGGLYALTALGIGLILGILRLIKVAHGDFITIGADALIVPRSRWWRRRSSAPGPVTSWCRRSLRS